MTDDSTPPRGKPKGYEARVAIMRSGLRPAAKFVAIRILDAQGLKEGACTLSAARLAADCGLSAITVKHALAELAECGALTAEAAPGKRARRVLDVARLVPTRTPVPVETPVPTEEPTGSQADTPPVPRREPTGSQAGTSIREGSEKDLERDLRSQPDGAMAAAEPGIDPHKLHKVYLARRRKTLPHVATDRRGPGAETGMWDTFWEDLAGQVKSQAAAEGSQPAQVASRLYAAAFADEWARDKGFPPKLLLSKFAEYVQASAPAARPAAKLAEPDRFFRWIEGHTLRGKVIDRVTDEEWFDDEPAPQSAIDAGFKPLRKQRAA